MNIAHPGDFETAFSLFTALEATADRWFNPEQQMVLMEGFDDFSSHDPGQVGTLLAIDITSSVEAQVVLARLAQLLQRLGGEASGLELALRYTRALDAVQLLRTVPGQ